LEDVNERIRGYEAEKSRLEALAEGTGVKALAAKNMLAQLDSSPLQEQLNAALITAEAAVRLATRKYGGTQANVSDGTRKSVYSDFSSGAVWWLNRDLEEKQRLYGKKKKDAPAH